MSLSPQAVLTGRFGYHSFRGLQEEVILHTLAGGNSLVLMPTGAGKSLCFQIPALIFDQLTVDGRKSLTLVLSPLIALMKDQVDALCAKQIEATFINSSLSAESRQQRYDEIANGRWSLLYVTPERFRKPEFLAVIRQRNIRLLAVDEAHCISEWGHDFRPDYTRLAEFRAMLGFPTTIALTATATPDVQEDIVRQLGLEACECRVFCEGVGRPNLELCVEEVWGRDEKLARIIRRWQQPLNLSLTKMHRQDSTGGSGIVYFTLIRTLQEISTYLQELNIPHLCYHGDLTRADRRRVQDAFMQGDTAWVLATNAFGMGVDKVNIRRIIHAEVPGSMESYYQEIGRAGRDGEPAECLLLYDQSDLETQVEFLRWSNPDADYYHRLYDCLAFDTEQVRAFGIEWLRDKLTAKDRRDRRLETALGMLQRYGVIEDETDLSDVTIRGELPESLSNPTTRSAKLLRDQRKLYAMVEYVQSSGNYRQFIENYFGINPISRSVCEALKSSSLDRDSLGQP